MVGDNNKKQKKRQLGRNGGIPITHRVLGSTNMEDNLKIDQTRLNMEDNLNIFFNARQPHYRYEQKFSCAVPYTTH